MPLTVPVAELHGPRGLEAAERHALSQADTAIPASRRREALLGMALSLAGN